MVGGQTIRKDIMLSIHEMRERDVIALTKVAAGEEPSAEAIATARRLMNSYYRLCGLCETNLYLANNAHTCDTAWTAESEERESRWYHRLAKQFEEFSGYTLHYCGYYPSICHEHNGAVADVIYPHFYE